MTLWANDRIRIVLTAECNINCFYCHNEGQPKSLKYFSEPLLHHLFNILKTQSEKLNSITFTGGEPLLHPNLESFISKTIPYSKSRTMVTNGLLLTKEKLFNLKEAGLNKIRLGVDSILKEKSRPTSGEIPKRKIHEIIDLLLESNFDFEINTVITKFNRKEIPSILQFCQDNKISGKFFEMVDVESYGDENSEARMTSNEEIPFLEFKTCALDILDDCKHYSDEKMNGANYIFKGNGFEVRYCKYLCDYKLCYKTGTRIDPDGAVYTCMSKRGKYFISPIESIESSKSIIEEAVKVGCPTKTTLNAG